MARSTVCRRDCEQKRKAQPTKVSCQCSASYGHKKYRGLLSQFPSRFRDFPNSVDTQVHASTSNATRGSHKRIAGTSDRTTDALGAPPNKRMSASGEQIWTTDPASPPRTPDELPVISMIIILGDADHRARRPTCNNICLGVRAKGEPGEDRKGCGNYDVDWRVREFPTLYTESSQPRRMMHRPRSRAKNSSAKSMN